jgi:hypothetical protein
VSYFWIISEWHDGTQIKHSHKAIIQTMQSTQQEKWYQFFRRSMAWNNKRLCSRVTKYLLLQVEV